MSDTPARAIAAAEAARLSAMAAGWKLRALQMEASGAGLSAQFLRECAEELEAFVQQRAPARTSWFAHESHPMCGTCGHPSPCLEAGRLHMASSLSSLSSTGHNS